MATSPRRRRAAPAATPLDEDAEMAASIADVIPMYQRRVQTEYVDITDIVPYEWNPRKNADAVAAVKKSIETLGFLVPCVVDADNNLLAGHTRLEAAKELGMMHVPCIRAEFLTPEQAAIFRLVDNKVAEKAEWDFDLLADEIAKLSELNIQWTDYGWGQEELDCLSQILADDCLNPAGLAQATTEQGAASTPTQRRAPTTVRIVVGEIVLFVQATQYRNWADGIRALHNFNEDAIAEDIKRRLGILE